MEGGYGVSRLERVLALVAVLVFAGMLAFPEAQNLRRSVKTMDTEEVVSSALHATGLHRAVEANVVTAERQARSFERHVQRTSRLFEAEVIPGVSRSLESTRLAAVDHMRASMESASRQLSVGVKDMVRNIYAGRSGCCDDKMGPLPAETDETLR